MKSMYMEIYTLINTICGGFLKIAEDEANNDESDSFEKKIDKILIKMKKYKINQGDYKGIFVFNINHIGPAIDSKQEVIISSIDLWEQIKKCKEELYPISRIMEGKYIILEKPVMSTPVIYVYSPQKQLETRNVYCIQKERNNGDWKITRIKPDSEKRSEKLAIPEQQIESKDDLTDSIFNKVRDKIMQLIYLLGMQKALEQIGRGDRQMDRKTEKAMNDFCNEIGVNPEDLYFGDNEFKSIQ